MKRNAIMEECRKLITPEIRRNVDLSVYVADKILDILEKQHRTQRDLAKMLGKSEAEISKWTQGTHNFTLSTIAKIEVALGENIINTTPKEKTISIVYHCELDYKLSISNNTKTFNIPTKWSNTPIKESEYLTNVSYGN